MQKETMEQLEKLIQINLSKLETFDDLDKDRYSRKDLIWETIQLTEKLQEEVKLQEEYWDREEKRRIDEEDKKASRKRSSKDQHDKKFDRLIEVSWKVGIPLITFVGGVVAYGHFQREILHFEETGKIVSKPGRELRFPFPRMK